MSSPVISSAYVAFDHLSMVSDSKETDRDKLSPTHVPNIKQHHVQWLKLEDEKQCEVCKTYFLFFKILERRTYY